MLEHTAVPAFSLVTTAVAMSAGSAALGKTVGKVYQKSKTLKKVGGGLTLAISAVPGGGAVAGFVRCQPFYFGPYWGELFLNDVLSRQ